jgi:hypothetical protein
MQEFFLNLERILSGEDLSMEGVPRSVSFEKDELKKKLRSYGINVEQSDEVIELFAKKGRKMEIASFVVLLSRYGIARNNISNFLKDLGLEDAIVINVLSHADELEIELGSEDISEYIMKAEDRQPGSEPGQPE